jgi:hypothetical protein
MSLLIADKQLELTRRVLGERKEVRNCRFDSVQEEPKLVTRSAGQSIGETVVYPGTPSEPKCSVEKQLELQKKIIRD